MSLTINSSGKMTETPNSVNVTQSNTTLEYSLDRVSALDWELNGAAIQGDSNNQASTPVVGTGGYSLSFIDANTAVETFHVIIYFTNRSSGNKHWHDPGVTNEPPV